MNSRSPPVAAASRWRAPRPVCDLFGDDDDGVFGCMSLPGCHDVCPKQLPLASQIAFVRRRMAATGSK